MVMLLYGTGVRIEEGVDLRVKDFDFDRHQIIVRRGKGRKDRVTILPDVGRWGRRVRWTGCDVDVYSPSRVSTRGSRWGFLLESPTRQ